MTPPRRPLLDARIALVYGPGNHAVDFAASLLRGIERGLLELGAEVKTLNLSLFGRHIHPSSAAYPADSPLIKGIVEFLRESWPGEKIDLCFGLFHDAYLSDELQETLKARCRRVVNYPLNLLDQPHRFERALAFCDATFCSEEAALEGLRARFGKDRILYVPMAADPYIHRPLTAPSEPRLLFVGTLYADRLWLLERCAEVLPVSVFGPNYNVPGVARNIASEWIKRSHRTGPVTMARMLGRALTRRRALVSDEEFVRLASEHGVSVGFSDVRDERTGELRHKVRLRDYEAPMSGLCHVARRLPELERGFNPGEQILLYDEVNQLPEVLASATSSGAWRRIGEAARHRAVGEHTWTHRLRQPLSDLL